MGTTHADSFRGDVPVTRRLTEAEVERDYERNTGPSSSSDSCQAVCRPTNSGCARRQSRAVHVGPGRVAHAIQNARVLEFVAQLEWMSRAITPRRAARTLILIDKHFLRKHGPKAYYGQ